MLRKWKPLTCQCFPREKCKSLEATTLKSPKAKICFGSLPLLEWWEGGPTPTSPRFSLLQRIVSFQNDGSDACGKSHDDWGGRCCSLFRCKERADLDSSPETSQHQTLLLLWGRHPPEDVCLRTSETRQIQLLRCWSICPCGAGATHGQSHRCLAWARSFWKRSNSSSWLIMA